MSQPLVLITGVTGFLAQHVVAATLNAGFRVRGTIRSASKANGLLEKFPKNFETVVVQDVATSDLTDVVKGVTYVLHTASPYTFAITNGEEELLKPAINGTLNVVRAAKKASVKKVVITSSFAAMTNAAAGGPWRDYEYTENDWNPSTYEEAAKEGADLAMVYSVGKKVAEQAAWDFAKENNMAVVALNPPMIYGPALQDAATSPASLNTSAAMIYQLFSGKLTAIPDDQLPLFVDVRDVANAHVLALQKDSASGARIPLCGGGFTWAQAVDELNATRPELRSRLVPQGTGNVAPNTMATVSTRVAAEKLGLKEFIGWKQSLSDTVDSLLELEKKWNAAA
ncbi:NAD(P)-binding protein [Athelia psychrophila]|uniref:NAD(P)-binding protein n=1 Tax=Athelia psychrophila TaxID=1759441 RepID=A0A166HX86_9AGAM|nr:NAD(P)-binding protein [Fibularhizoctonia sp. CBS 109695]